MTTTIVINKQGYAVKDLHVFGETVTISPERTVMIVACQVNGMTTAAVVYQADGTFMGIAQSSNTLLQQLETESGYFRRRQVQTMQRLLPKTLDPDAKSLPWVKGQNAFMPITCYTDGPTTWVNTAFLTAIETQGFQTRLVMQDAPDIVTSKGRNKFIKQLTAIKIMSLWMCQDLYGCGSQLERAILPMINWPDNVPINVDQAALQASRDLTCLTTLGERLKLPVDEETTLADLQRRARLNISQRDMKTF